MVAHTRTDEHGFSLTELLVVVSLLGMILGISYGGLLAIYKAREVSDRQGAFAREAAAPLAHMEKILTQVTSIENADNYTIQVLTDWDNNNLSERHIIEAGADGTLRHRTWQTDMAQNNTSVLLDSTWSTHNVNQAETRFLFEYYDADGNSISVADAEDDTAAIDMEVVVEYDDTIFSDERSALLRNMN